MVGSANPKTHVAFVPAGDAGLLPISENRLLTSWSDELTGKAPATN